MGNPSRREADQTDTDRLAINRSMAEDFVSKTWDVSRFKGGSIQATWTDVDQTNATMVIECSTDPTCEESWNQIGGCKGGVKILYTGKGSQLWRFDNLIGVKFLRLSYKANNVGDGRCEIYAYGLEN